MRDAQDLRHRGTIASSPSISRTPSYGSHLEDLQQDPSSTHVSLNIDDHHSNNNEQQQQQQQQQQQHTPSYSSNLDDLETGGTVTILDNNDNNDNNFNSSFQSPTRTPLHIGGTTTTTTTDNIDSGGSLQSLLGGLRRRSTTPKKSTDNTSKSSTYLSNSPLQHRNPKMFQPQKPLYEPALAVPDSMYRQYYYNQQGKHNKNDTNCCQLESCCRGCAYFSTVALSFMMFVGFLVDQQPLYLQGVRPRQCGGGGGGTNNNDNSNTKACANTAINYVTSGTRLPMASTAYKTAIAYFLTLLICMVFLYDPFNIIQTRIRRRQYHDIPDANFTNATAPGSGGLPIHMAQDSNAYGYYGTTSDGVLHDLVGKIGQVVNRLKRWMYRSTGSSNLSHNKAKKR
mmetsp:Transcript_13949/g.21748  ORF Transcript_13949/g.21748 Transcript_13949/m.21748 type:complete len:397 (+) Transcript_13949:384-1574(+)